jgi:GNAT superfamily N-acetyltransferase
MRVIDLTEEHESSYFWCLEEWSDEMKEAGDHKETWYCRMKERGLRVKLAVNDDGVLGGMIQYLPVEESIVEGRDLYFIPCVWVHGHKQGRGNLQGHGLGTALLEAAEADARERGAKGLAAWGLALPIWMKASWFRKHGFRNADRQGIALLLWKPFTDDALPPKWIRQRKEPEEHAGCVTVTGFCNGWCPAQNLTFERAKRASAELGDKVVFREIDTSDRGVFLEWGVADGVYVDGKLIRSGPPPSYERVRKRIAKSLGRL